MTGPSSTPEGTRGIPFYREFQPSALLSRYVECYWTSEVDRPVTSPIVNRVVPDGCIDIIFNLGDSLHVTNGHDAFMVGAMRQPLIVRISGRVQMLGIRFKPGGARTFFNFPLCEATDLSVPIGSVWSDGNSLRERVLEAPTTVERIRLLDRLLTDRMAASPQFDGRIARAVSLINETNGQTSIRSLENELNISSRQLERKFKEHVGLTPKVLGRVLRFQKTVAALRRSPRVDWSDLVFDGGFFDQPYFIHEFKSLSGLTPSAYLREINDVEKLQYGALA
jgi:AraC-like DNA-binding protein